jgi:hypothetical protein
MMLLVEERKWVCKSWGTLAVCPKAGIQGQICFVSRLFGTTAAQEAVDMHVEGKDRRRG